MSREFILTLNAIEHLIGAAHVHYTRMQATAREVVRARDWEGPDLSDQDTRDTARIVIFADTGGLIGTIHRLRLLLRLLPGDADTRMAKRAFESAVSHGEGARHHLEHIDGAIARAASVGHGALGTISWWFVTPDGKRGWTALVSWSFPGGKDAASTVVPAGMTSDVDHFWAVIAGEPLNVTALYSAVVQLEARLRNWGEQQQREGWPVLRRTRAP